MKKFINAILAAALVSVFVLTGCADNKNDPPATEPTVTTEPTTASAVNDSEIADYLGGFLEGDSDFYGAWQPKNFKYMKIVFRNDGLAELAMGNEGYFSSYTLYEKEKTISVQLMPGIIDGVYNYEFTSDKKQLKLSIDDNSLVLVKKKNFTLVPDAPAKADVDKDLVGWWQDEDGKTYCFQQNGIMYENSISMETCYTYSTENGKISAVYASAGSSDEEFTYSVKKDVLTLNGEKYNKIKQ